MGNTKEKNIELINNQIDKLKIQGINIDAWKSSTIILLTRIFGDNYRGINEIESIKLQTGGINNTIWNNLETCKKQGEEILKSCIIELENFIDESNMKSENKIVALFTNPLFWIVIVTVIGGAYKLGYDNGVTKYEKEKIELRNQNDSLKSILISNRLKTNSLLKADSRK
jgi:hypothetical protein